MRFIFALKVFFRILTQPQLIPGITAVLDSKTPDSVTATEKTKPETKPAELKKEELKKEKPQKEEPKKEEPPKKKEESRKEESSKKVESRKEAPKPVRSEAITLLAAFQREARFVDFLQEDIQPYDDAQVGAIVRDVHRGCADVIKRMFDLQPVTAVTEGESITIDAGFDPLQYQISEVAGVSKPGSGRDSASKAAGKESITGTVVHSGWKAGKLDLPQWTGSADAAMVIAPVEIEK